MKKMKPVTNQIVTETPKPTRLRLYHCVSATSVFAPDGTPVAEIRRAVIRSITDGVESGGLHIQDTGYTVLEPVKE